MQNCLVSSSCYMYLEFKCKVTYFHEFLHYTVINETFQIFDHGNIETNLP